MQNLYKLIILLSLIISSLTLVSCGKVSAPSPIEGSDYPHTYPRV